MTRPGKSLGLHGLLAGVIVPPMLLFGAVAWLDHEAVMDQARHNIQTAARVVQENAHNVFDTHRLVAKLIDQRIRGMGWDEIARSKDLHEYLVSLVRDFPKMNSLWLVDSTGILRGSSAVFPAPPINLTDRDYFIALQERDSGTFVGQIVHGRVLTEDIFNVAQRRTNAAGQFDGVIVVSAFPSYFEAFWKDVSPAAGSIAFLTRRDGTLLARIPPAHVMTPPTGTSLPLMQAITDSEAGMFRATSNVEGRDHLIAYRKIDGFPLYAGYGSTIAGILQVWNRHLVTYSAFFGVVTLGLASLTVVAYQRAMGEVAALQHWRETAEKLAREAEQRAVIEAQLRQSQKMEAFGQLAGGVAHDFNNLLQVISGSMDVLRNRVTLADQPLVALALESVERGRKMVAAMLAFARQQPLLSEVFDLNDTLIGMEGLLRPALGSRVKLTLTPAARPCPVRADRNQTELALLNLALNARDAMADGGALTVSVAVERLAGAPVGLVGDYGAVAVRDTGAGMPPDVQARAFEPFFTTKGSGKGTGLGLSMVYGLAEQSHGGVTIDSAEGEGTTVTLYLPAADANGVTGPM